MIRLIVLSLLLVSCVASTQDAEESLAQQFVNAVNAGDLEAYMAVYAPDAVVDDIGRVFDSEEELRSWGEALINADSVYTILSEEMQGETLVWTLEYRAGSYFLAGTSEIVAEDGKIKTMVIRSN
jgi:ketosteroid isomerase-like protein